MDGDHRRRPLQQRHDTFGVFAPQDCDQRLLPSRTVRPLCDGGDCRRRDGLPSFPAVGAGIAGLDREDAVQEEDALLRPCAEIAMDAGWEAEVVMKLSVNVGKAAGDGPCFARDGEGKSHGVSRCRIGILAQEEDFDVGQGLLERPEDVPGGGEDLFAVVGTPGGVGQSIAQLAFDWTQGIGPVGSHQLLNRTVKQRSQARVLRARRFKIKESILASHPAIVSRVAEVGRMTVMLFARNMGVGHFPQQASKECAVAEPAPEPMAPQADGLALEDLTAGTRSDSPLSERDQQMLALERQWWKYAGAKEQAIRELFDLSATHYYQILNALIDTEDALAHDPMLVKRLRRLRTSRQRARTARRLGSDA